MPSNALSAIFFLCYILIIINEIPSNFVFLFNHSVV